MPFFIAGCVGAGILSFGLVLALRLRIPGEKLTIVVIAGGLLGLFFNVSFNTLIPFALWQAGVLLAITLVIFWEDRKNVLVQYVSPPLFLVAIVVAGTAASVYLAYRPVKEYIAKRVELGGTELSVCGLTLDGHEIKDQAVDFPVEPGGKYLSTIDINKSFYHSTYGQGWRLSGDGAKVTVFDANCSRTTLSSLQRNERIIVYTGPQPESGGSGDVIAIKKEGGIATDFNEYSSGSKMAPQNIRLVSKDTFSVCGIAYNGVRKQNQTVVAVGPSTKMLSTRESGMPDYMVYSHSWNDQEPKVFSGDCRAIGIDELEKGDIIDLYTPLISGAIAPIELIKKVSGIVVSPAPNSPQLSALRLNGPLADVFKVGARHSITWDTDSWGGSAKDFPVINIQVVTDKAADCPRYFFDDVTVKKCFAHEIYSGPNNGSADWVVGDYPLPGPYYLRLWYDMGMSTSQQLVGAGYTTQIYSQPFTLLR